MYGGGMHTGRTLVQSQRSSEERQIQRNVNGEVKLRKMQYNTNITTKPDAQYQYIYGFDLLLRLYPDSVFGFCFGNFYLAISSKPSREPTQREQMPFQIQLLHNINPMLDWTEQNSYPLPVSAFTTIRVELPTQRLKP